MYNLHLTPEQLEFRDTVRGFVNDEVKPVTLKADRLDLADRTLPVDVLRKASQMGLRTLALPEDLGGVGADALTCCIVIEELAAGDTDVAAVIAETAALSLRLFASMTTEQGERFLQKFLEDDDYHLACAEREPEADTALGINYHRPASGERRLATTATRSGNDVIINGVKDHVANAAVARLIAVEAQTDKGPALILVPHDTPGLTIAPPSGTRWHHGAHGRIELKDCRVQAGNLIALGSAPDAGRAIPFNEAVNIGIGRAAYEAAVEYAKLRVQGGRPIAQHQAIGTKLADIAIRLDVARTMIWRAAWAADHPDAFADRSLPDLPLSTIAKVTTAEAVYRATKDAAECFGAMGVMRDMPLQKYIHDARVCLYSGDGAADDRLRIAEAVTQYRRGAPVLAAE